MDSKTIALPIRDLFDGYKDSGEQGVVAWGGNLDIRPPYQREFVYNPAQEEAVIHTVLSGFPLNLMYFVARADGTYEVLDGQQRILSICHYLSNNFSIRRASADGTGTDTLNFPNLFPDEQNAILDYELQVNVCSNGTDRERLAWFKVINTAGEKVNDQEILNATYPGPWITDAKRLFSKTNCPASRNENKNYLTGSPIKQDYLATMLAWAARKDGATDIPEYMADHQSDPNAQKLFQYFEAVMTWAKQTFTYRHEMKGLDLGLIYDAHKDDVIDTNDLERRIAELMMDDDVTKKRGIYYYVFDGDDKHLSIRAFTTQQKREAYERQQGICPACGEHFELDDMEADHITPWSKGGRTTSDNCQMLCKPCNRTKSGK